MTSSSLGERTDIRRIKREARVARKAWNRKLNEAAKVEAEYRAAHRRCLWTWPWGHARLSLSDVCRICGKGEEAARCRCCGSQDHYTALCDLGERT